MRRVTGIGGMFFKAADVGGLAAWYRKHLGLEIGEDGSATFSWREEDGSPGMTVWAAFPKDTDYFGKSRADFMINYRVEDLDALLAALRSEGVAVDDKIEEHSYGRFGWITDPDGTRIELWEPQPPKSKISP